LVRRERAFDLGSYAVPVVVISGAPNSPKICAVSGVLHQERRRTGHLRRAGMRREEKVGICS
jgi:hypothetical protein